MAFLVVKFGGTSVADPERIKHAAAKVAAEIRLGHKVVVVVSAMAGVTDQLLGYCRSISPMHDPREQDAVVATGENITAGLMAMALQQRGLRARSWQGWQVGIQTDTSYNKARIKYIETEKVIARVQDGEIAVIAGFQGINEDSRITTLGRGGGDITAVAIAAAVKADRCDIYTDVDGIYTSDPRYVEKAQKLKHVSFEEMLELASLGAKVLQTRSVEIAMRADVPIQVLSTFGNDVGSDYPGTLVTREKDIMESKVVTGLAHSKDDAKIILTNLADKPGVAAKVFGPLAAANINVDMIVQGASDNGKTTDMTFTVHKTELERAIDVLKKEQAALGYTDLQTDKNVVKISMVGVGMRSHAGIASTMFKTLAEKGINIQVISTSEIKVSVLVAEDYMELALRSLHTAFGLDKDEAA
jgi:aspartate kinase